MLSFSAQVHLTISEEVKDFLQCILTIPLVQRSWKKLVMVDSLPMFCGGPIPTNEARRLNAQACLCKFSFAHPLPILVYPLPINSSMLTSRLVLLFQRWTKGRGGHWR